MTWEVKVNKSFRLLQRIAEALEEIAHHLDNWPR